MTCRMSATSLPPSGWTPYMSDPVLYNTLTRKNEPLSDQSVGIYVCGVTPYDTTHLGHAFTYTAFDVLIRYLRFLGRDVTYVRNVTDIDDDILLRTRSREMHWKELGDREYAKFMLDMQHLNNLPPECEPRATRRRSLSRNASLASPSCATGCTPACFIAASTR